MPKFKIELKEIGRKKVSKVMILEGDKVDQDQAAVFAYNEADKYLMSSETWLSPDEDDEASYTMMAGMRPIGKVIITEEMAHTNRIN